MFAIIESAPDTFERVQPRTLLTSLDGTVVASVETVLSPSWTDEERAAFGVQAFEEPVTPDGEYVTSVSYSKVDGVIVQTAQTAPITQPAPAPPSALEFMLKFTSEERATIRASTNLDVQDFMDLCRAAQYVDPTNPLVTQGMALLVGLGLLTQARADEILA